MAAGQDARPGARGGRWLLPGAGRWHRWPGASHSPLSSDARRAPSARRPRPRGSFAYSGCGQPMGARRAGGGARGGAMGRAPRERWGVPPCPPQPRAPSVPSRYPGLLCFLKTLAWMREKNRVEAKKTLCNSPFSPCFFFFLFFSSLFPPIPPHFIFFFFSGTKNIIRKFFSGMPCFRLRSGLKGFFVFTGEKKIQSKTNTPALHLLSGNGLTGRG